jgi:hypothetical protein
VLVTALVASPTILSAQTFAERVEIWRRHGSASELQQLSRDLETGFRLALPTVHQEVLNTLPCKLTVVVQRPENGSMTPYRVVGDGGDLAERIETVVNDTTGVTGLRLLTRDAMPVLQGLKAGARPEELTVVTFWVGRDPAASELAAKRSLLARYVERCRRYF